VKQKATHTVSRSHWRAVLARTDAVASSAGRNASSLNSPIVTSSAVPKMVSKGGDVAGVGLEFLLLSADGRIRVDYQFIET
jgi:hypothetical protein